MFRSQRSIKVFLVAATAALALSALVVSSAAATIIPAKFSTSGIKLSGSGLITLKRGGIEPKTCELKTPVEAWAEKNKFVGGNAFPGEVRFACASSTTLVTRGYGEVLYDTVTGAYSMHIFDYSETTLLSPYGSYSQAAGQKFIGKWTNGSGATASTVTFTEAPIGYSGGKLITLSGTIKATTSTGGLLTLSH